ncbi:hypothetical protein [Amycolatopsis orientalis]|uniref:hypothetical protein n=1 Tax=Amycolatopsis orientalis TaxID=31958 RepID=UPI0003A2F7BE|nr:hypothetical protein [Amycolatopsis orientalis]
MDANEVRVFDLYSILAVTHGLPSTPQQYREIVGFLVGRPMGGAGMTAIAYGQQCKAWLFEQHPQLRTVPARPDFADDDEAAMDAWAAEQAKRLGADRLPVRRIPAEAAPGDPYTEFVNHAPDPWKVYNVDPDAPDVDPNAGWSE